MIKSAYFCSNWWQTRIVRNYFEILLVAVAYLVSPGHAQLGQYTLDINPKSSEGIFVTYFQVKGGHKIMEAPQGGVLWIIP